MADPAENVVEISREALAEGAAAEEIQHAKEAIAHFQKKGFGELFEVEEDTTAEPVEEAPVEEEQAEPEAPVVEEEQAAEPGEEWRAPSSEDLYGQEADEEIKPPGEAHYRQREKTRQLEAELEQAQRLIAQQQAFFQALQQQAGAQQQRPQAPQAPTDELPSYEDDAAEHLKGKTGQLEAELHQMRSAVAQMAQQQQQRQQIATVQQAIRQQDEAWEAQYPGYLQRFDQVRDALRTQFAWLPNQAKVEQAVTGVLRGALKESLQARQPPQVAIEKMFRTYYPDQPPVSPKAAPARKPNPQTEQAQAARKAQADGVAGSLNASSADRKAPITAGRIAREGVNKADIHEMLSQPGGWEQYKKIGRELEELEDD